MSMTVRIPAAEGIGLPLLAAFAFLLSSPVGVAGEPPLSPTALAATRDGSTLFVACATANRVLRFDTASRAVVASIPMPASPTGLALSTDGTRLFVTCASPQSAVCVVNTANAHHEATLDAGHTARSPVPSPDGQRLYVCNRFNDDVSFLDLASRTEVRRVKVQREPVAVALTPDGRRLLVANHLHAGRADVDRVAAVVSVLDTTSGEVIKELALPNGSGVLEDIRISPDGRHAVVTHLLARYHLPTTQLERGWMNTNAATLIDLATLEVLNTVLLDSVDRGAANPWALAWAADGRRLVVTHAGTHEISVIEFPPLLERLAKLPARPDPTRPSDYIAASRSRTDVPNDLAFLNGIRERLPLPPDDRGPRAALVIGSKAYVACYFSDTLAIADLAAERVRWESIPLGPRPEPTRARRGEFYFHDAGLCFQGWQSCASCHPGDGRVDALNWDLLNDGMGNPKNNKSMLWAHRTPPAMSTGVRDTAEMAVRAGLRHILFTVQPDEVPLAMDEYLKSLQPVPSPQLVQGEFSPAARRGQGVFTRAGCAQCHPSPLFTDLESYDVGTRGPLDAANDTFDTPTLVELWRTAPYLHDGSAATMREVLTTRNPGDQHGKTSDLSAQELDDLCAYLLAL